MISRSKLARQIQGLDISSRDAAFKSGPTSVAATGRKKYNATITEMAVE